MPLLNDIHRLTFVTSDLDRLIAFYEHVFGSQVTFVLVEGRLRDAFVEVGPHTVLHPFEIRGPDPPGFRPMFKRRRLDHFARSAAGEEAFWQLRRRLVAPGR